MKKILLIVAILMGNLSLISCTEESLAEQTDLENQPVYADDGTGGEEGHIDPPEEPPMDEGGN